jgi:hypothetical protein
MAIFFSPLLVAQFFKHHIPQMVQRFSKLHRVDQRPAGPVIALKPVQVLSRDQKRGNPPAVVSDPHPVETCAHAQQKRTLEQIGDFDGTFQWVLTSFQLIDFFGEMR